MRACVICAFKGSRLERCFRESWPFCWRKEFGICAERSFLHEVTLVNTHMKAQKYNQVSQMLVSKLIPQVDPHVKMGSAKVSRKKTRKDYTFSLKLTESQKGNFEQTPCDHLDLGYFRKCKIFSVVSLHQHCHGLLLPITESHMLLLGAVAQETASHSGTFF